MKSKTGNRALFVRYTMFMLGLVVMAVGTSFTIVASLGTAPWETFHIGLYYTFGLTIGTWSQIVGAAVIILSFVIARIKPGLGTVLNMVFFGLFIDLCLWLDFIPHFAELWQRWLLFLLGLMINSIGIGMYISPRLGAGPRDSLMLALHEKTGWSIQAVRVLIEVVVVIAGWLMDGPVAWGTILIALLTGPMIQWTIPFWEKLMAKPYGRRIQIQELNSQL